MHDPVEELNVLAEVLNWLTDTVNAIPDTDFSTLKIPLLRRGNACKDFEKEVLSCSSRSSGGRKSFRDGAKTKYMGEDIDGFRRSLAAYKLTIHIALTDIHLGCLFPRVEDIVSADTFSNRASRKSSAITEDIEVYNGLLDTARADLEDGRKARAHPRSGLVQ